MANQWDVAKYVEEHPDDYPQRWRLAKKLYLHWEYRLALEHLQVLRNEWKPRINVIRFLAATYYRLGRHEEAQKELRQALVRWPKEKGLYLQLARTCEVAGQRTEALEAWEMIRQLDPEHAQAKQAIQRLNESLKPAAGPATLSVSSDAGLDLVPGTACPSCGAQNSAEFDRCWQCHGPLPGLAPSVRRAIESEPSEPWPPGASLRLVTGVAILLAGAAIAMSLWRLLEQPVDEAPASLDKLFDNTLAWTRIGIGCGLLLCWPLAFLLALRCVACREDAAVALGSRMAVGFAAIAYLASFLPGDKLVPALLFPALASLFGCLGLLPISKVRALGVWAIQYSLAALAGVVLFVVLEWAQTSVWFNPLTEAPALQAYAREAHERSNQGWAEAEGPCPLSLSVKANSTGSAWLDAHAGQSVLRVQCGADTPGFTVELTENKSTVLYEPTQGASWKKVYPLKSGMDYTFSLSGPREGRSRIELRSLLKLEPVVDSPGPTAAESR